MKVLSALNTEEWILATPAENATIIATPTGLAIRNSVETHDSHFKCDIVEPNSHLGRILPSLCSQLLESGLADESESGLLIAYDDFVDIERYGVDAFSDLVPWSQFTLYISTRGSIGFPDFSYVYDYYLGNQIVSIRRMGCFVKRKGIVYRLGAEIYQLVNSIDQFNSGSVDHNTFKKDLIEFAKVKSISKEAGVQIDRYIDSHDVVVPTSIGVDLMEDSVGRITFVPRIQDVPAEQMSAAFLSSEDATEVYTLDHEGRNLHVVLDDRQRDVLSQMQKVRRVGGADKAMVLREPQAAFDGLADLVDFAEFGPRVKGIGDFPFITKAFLRKARTGVLDHIEGESKEGGSEKSTFGLSCSYADGSSEDIEINSVDEVKALYSQCQTASETGLGIVEFRNKSIVVNEQLLSEIKELLSAICPREKTGQREKGVSKYLLIYTNEDELEYQEPEAHVSEQDDLELPNALLDPSSLKPHQKSGVAWLQRNFKLERKGCLLADDMGLGKTLQILTFLAWLIEKGLVTKPSSNLQEECNPILIVAPLILIENETWISDMKKFFKGEGAVFFPCVTLRGSELTNSRVDRGKETALGGPVLDLNKLCRNRVIITNYDTVTNFQHSFAKLRDRLSVVVTDEAQEYKTPSTKISHALKSLAPRFRIAATGTPVETRLLDVWNIFDYLQPGTLMGSATEFRNRFENPLEVDPGAHKKEVLSQLRHRLHYGTNSAFVLRRDKQTELTTLPSKTEHKLVSDLSPFQRERHIALIRRAHDKTERCHPFAVLSELMKLYQHPALLDGSGKYSAPDYDEAVAWSPKLLSLLEQLDRIKSKGEKALVFTRYINMQDILKRIIDRRFDLETHIVNGNLVGGSRSSSRRKLAISDFEVTHGFNVLILSPEVAGLGLNLVAANHVFHYGRWWNPAKESQATDRVYRIGQTKPVHVYSLISIDPNDKFESFDVKLDRLLQTRRELASDFLAPMPSDDQNQQALFEELVRDPLDESDVAKPLSKVEVDSFDAIRLANLIACQEESRGSKVAIIHPSCGIGMNLVAKRADCMRLVICLVDKTRPKLDRSDLDDLVAVFSRARLLVESLGIDTKIENVVVANFTVNKAIIKEFQARAIELIDREELDVLMERNPYEAVDLDLMGSNSLSDYQSAIERVKQLWQR